MKILKFLLFYGFIQTIYHNNDLIDCHVFDFVDSSTTLTIVFIGIDSELYIRNATFINAQNYFAQAGIRGFSKSYKDYN